MDGSSDDCGDYDSGYYCANEEISVLCLCYFKAFARTNSTFRVWCSPSRSF